MKFVSIIIPRDIQSSVFLTKNSKIIKKYILNPDVHFLFKNDPIIVNYFMNIGYRNCTVYHEGLHYNNIGKYKTKGNFDTSFDIEDALIRDGTIIINNCETTFL